jgi:3-phenylpropionate/trans-cinnamate dioxygenase ferredoxin reductase subunit
VPNRFLIIGNGIAGTTCAEILRAGDTEASVTLVGLEPYPLYNRVALPRYLKGGIPRERVLMRTVEQHKEKGIDLRLQRIATGVDIEGKTVHFDDGSELPFDQLMICTGGRPKPYPAPGADEVRDKTYGFQTLDDTEALLDKMVQSKTALVVGGSFIAYELAEGFRHRGLQVYWVQRGPRFLRRVLDDDGGKMVDFLAKEAGVETIYNDEVAGVSAENGHIAVKTSGGRDLSVDMLGYGLGLEMYEEWIDGTPIDHANGLVVDEFLETTVAGIYAGGDIARFTDLMLDGRKNQMGTWDNSEEHGKFIAQNMLGNRVPYKEVPTYTTSMFNSNLAVMGITPETGAELESVTRLDMDNRLYRALFFYKGKLAGAVLIGTPKGRKKLLEMMQAEVVVAPGDREKLLDPANLAG